MPRNGSGTYILPTNSWNPATNGNSATAADWQSLIDDVESAVTQSLSADGQTPMSGNLNANGNKITNLAAGSATGDSLRWQQLFSQGANTQVPSAATVDIGAQNTNFIEITGTTTITSLGANYNGPRFLRFTGILILTHNATSLNLPGGANITTAAGDTCIAIPNSSANGWNIVQYQRAALVPGTATSATTVTRIGAGADIASAATLDLTTRTGNIVRITGTTTVTALTMNNGDFVLLEAVGALPFNVSGVLVYTCSAGDNVFVWQDNNGTQGAYLMRLDGLPRVDRDKIQSISASVGSNALTISASALTLDFRSTTLGSGTVSTVSGTPSNLVISSGSTLGTTSGVQSDIAVLAINNAGTIELAAVNIAGGVNLDESDLISTTAEGGAGAADSASTIYSTTARSNVAYRVLGIIRSTQATAGTWATSPSLIQGSGGNFTVGKPQYRRAIATATTSGSAVIYDNIPSWVKRITLILNKVSTNGGNGWTLVYRVSGSNVTSGYTGIGSTLTASSVVSAEYTTRAANALSLAGTVQSGRLVMENPTANTWILTGQNSRIGDTQQLFHTSEIDLAGALTGLSFSTSDTFDGGNINLILEG